MRVFVFTYDRYDTISTSPMLAAEGIEHTVLCHDAQARKKFVAAGRVEAKRLIATGKPKGLAFNRNAALDLMKEGEWALFLVDDLSYVCELEGYDRERTGFINITLANQSAMERRLMTRVPLQQFLRRCQELTGECEQRGAALGGFSSYKNPLFRQRKWAENVFVDGRAYVVRKTHLRFDENVHMLDDMSWTVLNMKAFGSVLVNRWILPACKRYTKGSYGSKEQRLEKKREEIKHLLSRHPGYVRIAKKKHWPWGTHVALVRRARPATTGVPRLC